MKRALALLVPITLSTTVPYMVNGAVGHASLTSHYLRLWSGQGETGALKQVTVPEHEKCEDITSFQSLSARNDSPLFRANLYTTAGCAGAPVTTVNPETVLNFSSTTVKSVKFVEEVHVVSMGDSYISGEGGRWMGNAWGASNQIGSTIFRPKAADNRVTDRTWMGLSIDQIYLDNSWTYTDGSTKRPGCHRSDVAEVFGAQTTTVKNTAGTSIIPAVKNIACSGAAIKDLRDSSATFKGEIAQVKQLRKLVNTEHKKVKYVVLSIGGNDLNLSELLEVCARSLAGDSSISCRSKAAEYASDQKIAALEIPLKSLISEISTILPSSARIIMQGYPSPFPRAGLVDGQYVVPDLRAGSEHIDPRLYKYGCPLKNEGFYAFDDINTRLNRKLNEWAKDASGTFWPPGRKRAFLRLGSLFNGHEVCSNKTNLSKNGLPHIIAPTGRDFLGGWGEHEWVRYVNNAVFPSVADLEKENLKQESVHPNFYGQLALGRCLSGAIDILEQSANSDLLYSAVDCEGEARKKPGQITVTKVTLPR
ncbi:hypothetical protein [Streptosporangium sp. NPDC049376]|uniref:hypothetical protein n=1 Tax=Streptosporangium sp. NPDC049376 TaxID=3366192 RepID=UPI00378B1F09